MEEPQFTKMSDDEIPSWSSIEAALDKLEAVLATQADSSMVAMAITQVPLAVAHFVQQEVRGFKSLFRARQPKAGEDINSIKTFSYPKPEVTQEGRANRIGFPVFYSALDADTAMKEVLRISRGAANNEEIYVGEWKPTAALNIKQFLHPAHASANKLMDEYHYGLLGKLREMLRMYSPQNQVTLERLAGRMGNYFLRERDYRVSATLAHSALYEFHPPHSFRIDAISYPSIVKDHKAINLAISPAWVDSNMKLVEVRKYEVISVEDDGTSVRLIEIGKPNEGQVDWFEVRFDVIRTIPSMAQFSPDDGLSYTRDEFEMNGETLKLGEFLNSFRRVAMDKLIEQAMKELNPRIMADPTLFGVSQTATPAALIKNIPLKYEGSSREAMLLTYKMECQYRLEGKKLRDNASL